MSLIDIGANLAHDSFDADRADVLARAHAAGIEAIVITGSSAESSRKALELARAHTPPPPTPSHKGRGNDPLPPCGGGLGWGVMPELYATAGLHPHHASEWNTEHAALLRDLARHPQLVALGECGLDYFRDLSPRDAQRAAFAEQLELAAELNKPVFLHQRDAHADFLPILREFRPQLADVVVHCFTDTEAALVEYLALDCHIGITGWICDERRNQSLLPALRRIPADRLLLETDAPYLLPRTARLKPRERRNEPMYLPWIARAVAQARAESLDQIATSTAANARRFFGLSATLTRHCQRAVDRPQPGR